MRLWKNLQQLFKNENAPGGAADFLKVDLHSHLIPGIDDGVADMEAAVAVIKEISASGVKKIITTPHIYPEFYNNREEDILQRLIELQKQVKEASIEVEIEAAAEYFLDDVFLARVEKEEPLLTFGNKMVLVETNYVTSHPKLKECFFSLKLQGYKPVFAHPERYLYLFQPPKHKLLNELFDFGILFQANLLSFVGHYGPQIKELALYLHNNDMIHLLGSDIHKIEHARMVNRFKQSKLFESLCTDSIENNKLL